MGRVILTAAALVLSGCLAEGTTRCNLILCWQPRHERAAKYDDAGSFPEPPPEEDAGADLAEDAGPGCPPRRL